MNATLHTYRLLSGLLSTAVTPAWLIFDRLWGDGDGQYIKERLGMYRTACFERPIQQKRLWMHAVSVGEVKAAGAIIDAVRQRLPNCFILLSSTTRTGFDRAKVFIDERNDPSNLAAAYAPVDFPAAVKRALRAVKPHALVCLETELWPNWLFCADRLGVKTALVNGRISERTIHRYMKVKPLIKAVLDRMAVFSMIYRQDASRIGMLGAPVDRIRINGNAKFDVVMDSDPQRLASLKAHYRLENAKVLVAGSIRGVEDVFISEAFREIKRIIPETVLIMAPRHPPKVRQVVERLSAAGFGCQRHSELMRDRRRSDIVVVDTIGELKDIYGLADVVFCGGSLVPKGGQNVLEPAALGKPVLFGPSMEDFMEAGEMLLSCGAAATVTDAAALSDKVRFFLSHPQEARQAGRRARTAIAANSGAAGRHAEVICDLLVGEQDNARSAKP